MMKITVFGVVALCMFAQPVLAQDKGSVKGWTAKGTFDLGIRLGKNLPLDADPDLVDESELGAKIAFKRKSSNGLVPLQFSFGITDSPGLVKGADPASTYFGRITIGDAYLPLRELTLASDPTKSATAVSDAIRPYAYYQYSSLHDGLLKKRQREDNEVGVGLRYRDVVTIMADRAMNGSAEEVGAATNTPGWYWEASGQIARIWSSNPDKEKLVPQVKLSVYSPIIRRVRFFAKGQGDFSFYQSALTPMGDDRQDQRLRVTAGVDLSSLVEDWGDVSLEIAGQFQRQWSNDPTAESTRGYFLPSASISFEF
ncbi:hypothetical protein FSZ31_01020 [Sphingorhabdus soli]|uniref:DUF2219 family protein n=1 Tax=Flavisphingopyxis soli TaxID=2601267 RepID=A0A5C6ULK5_9SPHN|nr:hypothetical protein [Sphingorhabdus soli]TXC73374.1 hypothetical protein FSZ31_01020 [Sphingorhabdus soli]